MATGPSLSTTTSLPAQVSPQPQGPVSSLEQEMRIERAARAVIENMMVAMTQPEDVGHQIRFAFSFALLPVVLQQRAALLTHIAKGARGTLFSLDMTQIGQAPTPLCPFYNKMRFPTISTYGNIATNIVSIRLDPSALRYVPAQVLQMAGNLSGKHVDLLYTAVDARFLLEDNRSFNLCTHPWTHPNALKRDDVRKNVLMGIHPEIGFANHRGPQAIAINSLSAMPVHSHDELYSPDNAHFERLPGSPFGLLWAVMQDGNRIAFTKMLVLFDYDHPICQALVSAVRDCPNLETHLQRLDAVKTGIAVTFDPLITGLEEEDPVALRDTQRLPPAFQEGILNEIREMKGPSATLDSCSPHERAEAVRRFAGSLQRLLLDSQFDLLVYSQPLGRQASVVQMMRCAQLFDEGQTEEGDRQFQTFTENEKAAVYFAFWEICECPRGNPNFGRDTFPIAKAALKKEAILLAASRPTTPEFVRSFTAPRVEEPAASWRSEAPSRFQLEAMSTSRRSEEPTYNPFQHVTPPTRAVNPTPPPVASAPATPAPAPAAKATLQEVNDAILDLVGTVGFLEEKEVGKKRCLIMEHLDRLDDDTKNQIFEEVYNNYPASRPLRTSVEIRAWGRANVAAEDGDVLAVALQAVLHAQRM